MIKELERYNFLFWIITILIAGLIFYFSTFIFSKRISGAGDISNWKSIAYHITIFFALALFFFISFIKEREDFGLFLSSILLLVSYGILDEMHQFFVPGRYASLVDVGFDFIGILFAFMFYLILLKLE